MPAVYLSPVFNGVTLDSNGNPASGWLLYTYDAGTTTPKATYTSQAGSSAQANPIVLNARGESDNPIWLQSGETKFLLKTAAGVDVRTVDDVSGIGYVSTSSDAYALTSVSGTNTITGSSGASLTAYTVGNTFYFTPAADNTGAVTLNVDSLGGGAVQLAGKALRGGDLRSGVPVQVIVTAATPVFEIIGDGTLMTLANPSIAFKNRYANGDFSIDQVNEGATAYSISSTTAHALDCVRGTATGAGTFTLQRVADPSNANKFAMKIACTTADASIAATDNYYVTHLIEGYDVADMNFGLSSAESLTISFKMQMDVTGTYGISITNSAENRVYVGTVTQNVASTEESKTLTLTADTSGTWLTTNGTGLRLRLCLAAGSNFQGTAGAWGASNIFTTSAQANFMSANTNVGYIKELQIEKGASASVFERVSRSGILGRLQRYFEKAFNPGVAVGEGKNDSNCIVYTAQIAGTTAGYTVTVHLKVSKRADPTIVFYNYYGPGTDATWANVNGGGTDSGTPSCSFYGRQSFAVTNPQAAGDSAGNRIIINWTADSRMT